MEQIKGQSNNDIEKEILKISDEFNTCNINFKETMKASESSDMIVNLPLTIR